MTIFLLPFITWLTLLLWHAANTNEQHHAGTDDRQDDETKQDDSKRKWKSNGGIIGSKAKSFCNGV
jgi:hypothetical protein